jgi:hypothetical protein
MLPIYFRALSTVVTVVIAVIVSATLGDTGWGKIWAAVLIAVVIAGVEWLLIWAPGHFALARQLLDPRADLIGVWIQVVNPVRQSGISGGSEGTNQFAIFWVDYRSPDSYVVTGFAYTPMGVEYSEFWSEGTPEFGKDGRSMIYRWAGTIMDASIGDADPDRTGIASFDLNRGTGRVEHVGMKLDMRFRLRRVNAEWLKDIGLNQFAPTDLKDPEKRDRFARAYARTLVRAPEAALT